MAPVLDGYPAHMAEMTPDRRFEPADLPEPSSDDVIRHLDQTGTEVLVNYLPVGSQQATEFFAECALRAGVAFVRSEEHTSELQSLMRISYAVFCLKKKNNKNDMTHILRVN